MTRIGDKIKTLRSENGMTQKALAKKLGVSEKFINEIESGKRVANEAIITRISKIFGKQLDDVNMYAEEQAAEKAEKKEYTKVNKTIKKSEANDVWSDALSSILKNVPVYNMDLKTVISTRQLPVVANKIEGYAQDKVSFIEIENDEMLGFRIAKGDIAFVHMTSEIINNSICLIEYNNEKMIRQIKKIDSSKILLVSNASSVRTQTVNTKELKVLAKLEKVEIKL